MSYNEDSQAVQMFSNFHLERDQFFDFGTESIIDDLDDYEEVLPISPSTGGIKKFIEISLIFVSSNLSISVILLHKLINPVFMKISIGILLVLLILTICGLIRLRKAKTFIKSE